MKNIGSSETFPINAAVNEIERLSQQFAEGDILDRPARCIFGFEIDFTMHPNQNSRYIDQDVRQLAREEIDKLEPSSDAEESQKREWLAQIPELNSCELANFIIYSQLARPTFARPNLRSYFDATDDPQDTLEFRFGNGLYQTGYYDNPGGFEMRTNAAPAPIALRRLRRTLNVAQKISDKHKVNFSKGSGHINFSVLAEEDGHVYPIHELNTAEGLEIARRGAAGILTALSDANIAMYPPLPTLKSYEATLLATHDRNGVLRVSPDRFEYREDPKRFVELGMLAMMSGFAHGYNKMEISGADIHYRHDLAPDDGFDKIRDLHLLRALQYSQLDEDRYFHANRSHISLRDEQVLLSIFGREILTHGDGNTYRNLIECIFVENNQLRVNPDRFNQKVALNSELRQILKKQPLFDLFERIKPIKFIESRPTIQGKVVWNTPTALEVHQALKDFAESPSLRFIDSKLLNKIATNQIKEFNLTDALLFLADQKIFTYNEDEVPELIKQFPVNPKVISYKIYCRLVDLACQQKEAADKLEGQEGILRRQDASIMLEKADNFRKHCQEAGIFPNAIIRAALILNRLIVNRSIGI